MATLIHLKTKEVALSVYYLPISYGLKWKVLLHLPLLCQLLFYIGIELCVFNIYIGLEDYSKFNWLLCPSIQTGLENSTAPCTLKRMTFWLVPLLILRYISFLTKIWDLLIFIKRLTGTRLVVTSKQFLFFSSKIQIIFENNYSSNILLYTEIVKSKYFYLNLFRYCMQ